MEETIQETRPEEPETTELVQPIGIYETIGTTEPEETEIFNEEPTTETAGTFETNRTPLTMNLVSSF